MSRALSNQGRRPRNRTTGSQDAWANAVPPVPVVAPMIATGRPRKTRGISAGGRDSQSIAFFNTPGSGYADKFKHHEVPGPNFVFEGPHARQVEIFFSLYFAMTGLHALHMIIGVGLMGVITWMAYKRRFSPEWYAPVEMSGLYWHFVDIVWIFLFPLLYLVDRAHKLA